MRLSRCAGKLALIIALSSGCGQQPTGTRFDRNVATTHASGLSSLGTPGASSQPAIIIGPQTPASQAELHRVALAVDDCTVMGQSLPEEIKEQWRAKVRSLEKESSSSIRVVTDPADADWLVQVAALERTDILYLVPSERHGTPIDDEQLRMSPPGEPAIAWLKAQLEHVARDANLSQNSEQQTRPDDSPDEPDIERLPEPSPSPPAKNADPILAALNQAIENGEKERQQREELRKHWENERAVASASKAGALFSVFRHGPAEDLKAEIVEEQSGVYQTPNRTQAVLGTYGKMAEGNRLLHHLARFEHRGIVRQLDRVRRFTTVQRKGSGAGKDFVSLVGNRQAWQIVDLAAQVSGGRHQEVAFEILGVRLDQNDVIKALNADADALDYFKYLRQQKQIPCLVLENLVLTSYAAAHGSKLNVGTKANIVLASDGIGAQVEHQSSAFTELTSPVIRCYQAYEVKLHGHQVVELVNLDP